MILKTKNSGSNYLAKVVKLGKPIPFPGADKLQLFSIDFNTVITGLAAKEGDIYCFFPIESCLNKEYLSWSNSFAHPELNADKTKKGFFNDSGRVRAIKLRGQKAEGYIVPIDDIVSFIEHVGKIPLPGIKIGFTDEVGKEFDSIEFDMDCGNIGVEPIEILLCEKYVPANQKAKGPANTPKQDKTKRHDRIVPGQFRFHVDTANLKKNIHLLKPSDIVSISYKLHGTSAVFSRVLTKRKLKWHEKLLQRLGVKIQDTEYGNIYSSRGVIKNAYLYPDKVQNHWYKTDIWGDANSVVEPCLEDGITIYAEIVGYTSNGGCIQKNYDYGCQPGQFEIYVYRITSTNAQGKVLEFTTNQMDRYCARYGLKIVPIWYYGKASDYEEYVPELTNTTSDWHSNLLITLSNEYLEKDCHLCKNKVPAEGIVLSIEGENFTAFKLKSYNFLERETKALDNQEVDLETEQTGFTADERGWIG